MTVMERFDLPTGSPADARDGVPAAWSPPRPDTREPALDAVVSRGASSFDGLLALGALAGSAVAGGFALLVGWTGTAASVAALVGLDVGVLVGAGTGSLLARRHGHSPDAVWD